MPSRNVGLAVGLSVLCVVIIVMCAVAIVTCSCSSTPTTTTSTGQRGGARLNKQLVRADTTTSTSESTTCSAASAPELDALCTASGFAGYDTQQQKCYNLADCDQQSCTASYCTNATVKAALGDIKKKRTDYNTCENPTNAEVATMCQQQPNKFWQSPNCYKFEMQNTIVLETSSTTPPDTSVINCILRHPLLNVGDGPISYTFRLLQASATTTGAATATAMTASPDTEVKPDVGAVEWLSETHELPSDEEQNVVVATAISMTPAFPSLAFERDTSAPLAATASTTSTSMTVIKSGTVSIIDSCATDDSTSCVNAVMYLSGSTPLKEGSYVIQIDGRPSWNPSSVLYQLTDPAGVSMYLLPAQNGPGVTPVLNPVLSASKAQQLATNQAWVNATLSTLSASYSTLIQVPSTDTQLAYVEPESDEDKVLLVGCTPAYCKPTTNQVRQKMVVLAWDKISSSQVTQAACVSSNGTPLTYVKYMLLRSATNSSAGGTASFTELIGPSTQPLTSATTLSFVDVLPINTVVQYILAAYVVASSSDTTSYGSAVCKSQQIYASVNVGDYSAAFCHGIKGPQPLLLPPWYWRDPNTGMCQWMEKTQGARDYYCMFEVGTNKNPAANFDTSSLYFATSTESCAPAVKQFAKPTTIWSNQYCLPYAAGGNYANTTCISGAAEEVGASCTKQIQAGDMISESDFKRRLDQVVNFYSSNNTYSGTEAAVSSITGADKQAVVWSAYNQCGPALTPTTWGTDIAECGDDEVCQQYAKMGGCDRNYCAPWVEQGTGSGIFRQKRTCYPPSSVDGTKSKCCNSIGTYALDTSTTGARGKCTNCGETYSGAQCTESACTGQTCSGHGTCVIDQETGAPRCQCDSNYFNVTAQRPMHNKTERDDCEYLSPGCQYYIVDPATGQPTRNPQCNVSPRKCLCPPVSQDLLSCRQNSDPNDASKDPRTGCSKQCAYGVMSSPSNPYTYRDPDNGDFLCTTCKGDGERVTGVMEVYECCSGKSVYKCVKKDMFGGCAEYDDVCSGWNP